MISFSLFEHDRCADAPRGKRASARNNQSEAADSLIRIMAHRSNRIKITLQMDHPTRTESIMDKRSTLEAVYAESLVFESNFGPAAVAATHPSSVVKRAEWIPAWSAAALACESIGTSDKPTSPTTH
jgi:hypothetical protein